MEQSEPDDSQLVTLTDADGRPQLARVFSVFPFEDREYALLLRVDDAEAAGAGPLTLMRIVERGEQAVFQSIESDEEFERVKAFIRDAARQTDEEKE